MSRGRLGSLPSQTIGPFYHFGLTRNAALGCLALLVDADAAAPSPRRWAALGALTGLAMSFDTATLVLAPGFLGNRWMHRKLLKAGYEKVGSFEASVPVLPHEAIKI